MAHRQLWLRERGIFTFAQRGARTRTLGITVDQNGIAVTSQPVSPKPRISSLFHRRFPALVLFSSAVDHKSRQHELARGGVSDSNGPQNMSAFFVPDHRTLITPILFRTEQEQDMRLQACGGQYSQSCNHANCGDSYLSPQAPERGFFCISSLYSDTLAVSSHRVDEHLPGTRATSFFQT